MGWVHLESKLYPNINQHSNNMQVQGWQLSFVLQESVGVWAEVVWRGCWGAGGLPKVFKPLQREPHGSRLGRVAQHSEGCWFSHVTYTKAASCWLLCMIGFHRWAPPHTATVYWNRHFPNVLTHQLIVL